jgi:cellulase/cellobiase CelA1
MTYTVTNAWPGNFQGDLTIRNTGTTPTNGWTLAWTFGGNQRITQLWGGEWSQNGTSVTVRNMPWNGVLAPGASMTIGFLATVTGANVSPTNGTCTRT